MYKSYWASYCVATLGVEFELGLISWAEIVCGTFPTYGDTTHGILQIEIILRTHFLKVSFSVVLWCEPFFFGGEFIMLLKSWVVVAGVFSTASALFNAIETGSQPGKNITS